MTKSIFLVHAVLVLIAAGADAARAETYNFIFEKTPLPELVSSAASAVAAGQQPAREPLRRWTALASGFAATRDGDTPGGFAPGMLVGAAFAPAAKARVIGFFGIRDFSRPFGVAEGEYLASRGSSVDVGPVLGINTFQTPDGVPLTLHGGFRFDAHVGSAWGRALDLTATVRANLGYAMGDAGLAFHL